MHFVFPMIYLIIVFGLFLWNINHAVTTSDMYNMPDYLSDKKHREHFTHHFIYSKNDLEKMQNDLDCDWFEGEFQCQLPQGKHTHEVMIPTMHRIKSTYKWLDQNDDGIIEKHELKQLLTFHYGHERNFELNEQEHRSQYPHYFSIQDVLDRMDFNGDDKVSKLEYFAYMRHKTQDLSNVIHSNRLSTQRLKQVVKKLNPQTINQLDFASSTD